MKKYLNIETLLKYPIIFYSIYFLYLVRPDFKLINPNIGVYESMFHYLLMGYGLIIILYNLIYRKYLVKDINIIVTVLLSISILFTIILNLRIITLDSIKTSILTVFSMVIMLPAYKILSEKYSKEQIFKIIFYPAIFLKIIISILSLFMYYYNISIYIIDRETLDFLGIRYVEVLNGNFTPLLYGVYKDPNYGAMYGIATFIVILYILFSNKISLSKIEKSMMILFLIIEYKFIAFSNSRGAFYSIYVVGVLLILVYLINVLYKKSFKNGLKKLFLLVGGLLVFSLGFSVVQKAGFYISQKSDLKNYVWVYENNKMRYVSLDSYNNLSNNKIADERKIKNKVVTDKEDSTEELGNGRLTIWKDALTLYKKNPIFGIGPSMQKVNADRYEDISIPSMQEGRAMHNSYINILLSYGIVGFLIIILWLFTILCRLFFKQYFIGKFNAEYIIFYGMLVLLGTYMFLDAAFINITYQQIFFMFFVGYLSFEYNKLYDNRNE
ncbi:O-antigen ligase family protein [Gemella sp. GH3]|uniref:O-antigen ligase family protein n=1 Tax=unclassified Gemella TaxID=2624949 RepID=UPI0015CFB952|nr:MULTISPECIES: O-antigen ligase family protein [unclassified Gemella]MBF0713648.1 O-antigen ligase family protein [Gemella sp. GH3.1]NYS50600.1 O-antigen ligase family protein [Gemella sp. GH3]